MKKLIVTITLCMCLTLTACSPGLAKNLGNGIANLVRENIDKYGWSNAKYKLSSTESKTIKANDLISLTIDCELADINLIGEETSEVSIDIKVEAGAESEELAKELLNKYTYTAEIKNGTLVIDTKVDRNLLNGNDDDERNKYIAVYLDVQVPKDIEHMDISSNMGNITARELTGNLKIKSDMGDIKVSRCTGPHNIDVSMGNIELKECNGSYDISTNMGSIYLDDCAFSSDSRFEVDMGDMDLRASSISDADSITSNVSMGDISLKVPANSDYNADINRISDSTQLSNGSGKTKITLDAKSGNVDFD